MKKLIIVLMILTAVLCYSQGSTSKTQKVVSKSASKWVIQKPTTEQLKKAIDKLKAKQKASENNLYSRINRLKDEKNILEKKFEELDTGKILEKSQNFYSASFSYLLVLVAALGALLYFSQRKDLKNEKELILKSFESEKKYLLREVSDANEKLKTTINTTFVDSSEKIKIEISNTMNYTNETFARNFILMAIQASDNFQASNLYIYSALFASKCDISETLLSDKIFSLTMGKIKKIDSQKNIGLLKNPLNNLKDSKIPTIEKYYTECLAAINEREAELKKKAKKK